MTIEQHDNDDHISDHNLEQTLRDGGGTEVLDTLDVFSAAKGRFLDVARATMHGEGESDHVDSAVQLFDDEAGGSLVAGRLIVETLNDLNGCLDVAVDEALFKQTCDEIGVAVDNIISYCGADEQVKRLSTLYFEASTMALDYVLEHSLENKNEALQARREALKSGVVGAAREVGKIALGAAAAVAALRLFDKFNKR